MLGSTGHLCVLVQASVARGRPVSEGLFPEPAGPLTWVCLALEGKHTDVHCEPHLMAWGWPSRYGGPRWHGRDLRGVRTLTAPQVFHVAYVLIKFANSPRPDLWVLERSTDFGHTYQPWQYFACESPGARGVPWGGPHALSGSPDSRPALTPASAWVRAVGCMSRRLVGVRWLVSLKRAWPGPGALGTRSLSCHLRVRSGLALCSGSS